MTNGLKYSNEGLSNRSIFIKNSINIYVEDADTQYLYEDIFKRLLGEKYKIEAIFAMGGKPNVLKAYIKKGETDSDGVPNIFLLDGDFDRYIDYKTANRNDFTGTIDDELELDEFVSGKMFESESVIYLKTYNIESYFIDEHAIVKCIKGILRKKDEECLKILDFSKWKNRIVEESKDLFLTYCFIVKYINRYGSMYGENKSRLSIKNVNRSPFPFLDSKTGFKSNSTELENLRAEIISALKIENPEVNLDDEIQEIKKVYESLNRNDYYNLICGKFLFSSLTKYLETICSKKLDAKMFEWDLVRNFEISKLDYVKLRIIDSYDQ